MSKRTKVATALPVGPSKTARTVDETDRPDAEVLAFRANFEGRSALDELIRTGAQTMLQAAINAEVDEFLQRHADHVDDDGRRQVVCNGHLPSRELFSGAGRLQVRQPRVRDKSPCCASPHSGLFARELAISSCGNLRFGALPFEILLGSCEQLM